LPTTFGDATQAPALQKAFAAQPLSVVQLVPQAGGDPAQTNPLQLWVAPATHVPAPLQTLFETTAPLAASQAGVESQTCVDG
jgi:hypothetical protein